MKHEISTRKLIVDCAGRSQRIFLAIVLAALISGFWSSALLASAHYSYSSDNFDDVQGGYTTAMNVTGGLTLSARLPPNLPPGTDISAQVVSYSFNDGVQTLTQDNSYIATMRVTTDSFCRMSAWSVTFWQGADPVSGIDVRLTLGSPEQSQDNGFIDAPCDNTVGGQCISNTVSVVNGTDYGLLNSFDPGTPGTWTGPECPETPPPEYAYSSENFDEVQGAYTTDMNVTAGLVLSAPLPPNLPPGTDISGEVLGYSFNDGVQTLDQDNSYIASMRVGTDSFCRISTWSMTFWQGADPVSGIDVRLTLGSPEQSQDNGFIDAPCGSTAGGQCVADSLDISTATDYGQLNSINPGTPGTWTGPECPETPPPEYTYTSGNFDDVQGAYTTAMNVTGGVTLSAQLPPNLPPGTDISGDVLSYRFSDGVQTMTQDNSYIASMRVTTDSFCRISTWAMTFWQGSNPVSGIDVLYSPGSPGESRDDGFIDAPCSSTAGARCVATDVSVVTGTDYGLLDSFVPTTPGRWTGPICAVIPTTDAKGLVLLTLLLGSGGLWFLRRRRPA